MVVLEWIPWLDIFLALLFVGLIVLGFWQGLLKELWFLISLYLGAVLASLYGDALGGLIGRAAGSGSSEVVSSLGFFIVITLATAIVFTVVYTLFGRLRLRETLLVLDKVGGITLGVLTSFLVTSFIAFVLNALLLSPIAPQEWAFVTILRAQRPNALFLRLFMGTRTVIMTVVAPWLPELPRFLRT